MDAKNYNQQCLLIADEGGTGKGEMTRLLIDIMPKDFIGQITNECLSNPRFAVSSHGIHKHHILVNTEYDGKSASNSELFKQLTGGDTISCEIKGGDSFIFNTKGLKMILSSNKVCYTKEHAIRRRLIPVSFKRNYDPAKGMDEMMKIQLRKDGPEFLKYCYKIYMKSPFRKLAGEYIVMNEEQEREFLANKRKLPENLNYEKFLMKAFSADKDIAQFFKCGDYTEETHLNDDFEDVYNALFEFDENEYITVKEMKTAICEYCKENEDYADSFDFDKDNSLRSWVLKNMNGNRNSKFITYLEKTKGHEWNVTKYINKKTIRVVTNIKFKKKDEVVEEKIDEEFIDRLLEDKDDGLDIEHSDDFINSIKAELNEN